MATRRLLLKAGLLAGGGLLLGLRLPGLVRTASGAETGAETGADFEPNAYVRIDPAGIITLIMGHTEFGQGIYTSSAMLIGEELEVGLDQIRVEAAPPDAAKYADPLLGEQATGGSTSTRADWMRLRQAGAAARIMLVAAAASRWQVNPTDCRVARGVIFHAASNRSLGYGDVASDAAAQPVPKDVPLKDRSKFTLIGTAAKRVDTPAKVNGTAQYGIDVRLPGMRIGTLAISPVKGGKLASTNDAAARQVPGVHDIIRTADGSAVAVIADHMWAAKQGLAALAPVWDPGPNGAATLASIVAEMDQVSQHDGVVAKRKGDAQAAIAGAVTQVSAIYQSPFLSHSPMEPVNCTLHIQPDRAEMWVGTQVPVRARNAVAKATGLPPEKITINNMLIGGAFGRALEVTSIDVAAAIAKQVPYPVKLVWTREQDVRHDNYRPYYYDRVSAGLDAAGKIVGRTYRTTGSSIYARWAPEGFVDGLDPDAVEGALETPYDIPAELVEYVRHEPPLSTSWWRGVGPTHNLFVVESLMDELALAAKKDPVEFRRAMLGKNPRALAALNLAAEKSGWGTPLPPRTGRGISVQFAFGSYLSNVTEIEVSPQGEIILRRVVVVVDCGSTVNPDTVQAQMQGGIILALGTSLYNHITLTKGAVDQSNFHDYRALRMNEAPKIEVYQIHNEEDPGGVGEAGTASVAASLGNAIFMATGQRLRQLPFSLAQLQAS